MKILAVLYCYPPLLVPAAMCYLKLMAGLSERGVEIEILTIYPDSFDSPGEIPLDETLSAVAPPNIVNHQVWSPETSFKVRTLKRLDPSRRFSYRWLEPRKREWTGPALERLGKLDLDQYDLMLTCSQPHANHLVGLEWQRRTGKPWVAYFSDPWTDNPYAHFASDTIRAFHRELEDEVLARADLVLFTCEEMRQLVVQNHPALDETRSGILPHAFIPEWYGAESPSRLAGPPVQLLHTGSFYGPRTPQPLIDALWRVGQRHELRGRIRIDSYGGMEDRHRRLIQTRKLGGVLEVHGFVAYLESLRLMKSCDALLLVDAALTTTAQSVFLPSKLVDYFGSGRPVIAVTPRHGTTARLVAESGGVVVPIEDPEALDRTLLDILDRGAVASDPREELIGRFHYHRVADDLIASFSALGV